MSLKYVDKEELVDRVKVLQLAVDEDLLLAGTVIERMGRSAKELETIREELDRREEGA